MSHHATIMANAMATAVAIWATVYSWVIAFADQVHEVTHFRVPIADIPMQLDQKAAVFAGIAAGTYWTLKVIQLAIREYKKWRETK